MPETAALADPLPPGGRWRPLDDAGADAIIDTAMRLLEEPGMGAATPRLVEVATEAGCAFGDDGRLRFPRALVEDVIARAPERFVFHGRRPGRDIEVGGDAVHFGTAGAAVMTLDMETRRYRPSTLADLHDFARLSDALENISWFSRNVVATDVADNFEMDANTGYALLRGTDRPTGMSFTDGSHVDPIVDMFEHALGGEGDRFARRPFCKAKVVSSVSPLRFTPDAVGVTEAAARRGMPVMIVVASQSGATAPAPLAGALAQSTAETLAGVAMVDFFRPGHPVIFCNLPFVCDLRTGSFTGGGGECAVMNAAAAQIARALGIPSGVSASMSDAKAVDAQMGAEKGLTSTVVGLAGGNLVYESASMMASLLGASLEAFVLDDEMIGRARRLLRGLEVDDDALRVDEIMEAALAPAPPGPPPAARAPGPPPAAAAPGAAPAGPGWAPGAALPGDGGPPVDSWERAGERARAILASHRPRHLDARADEAIRSRLNIHLPPEGA